LPGLLDLSKTGYCGGPQDLILSVDERD